MSQSPIELAYRAHTYVPSESYRRGRQKKMYNPIRTTPALVQAMTHLGPRTLGINEARRRAKDAVREPEATRHIDELGWDSLLSFLDTIAIFLKAGSQGGKERGMRKFEDRGDATLKPPEISQRARALAGENIRGDVGKNKLKKMGAHITAARNKWEALAALARFYPRSGIPCGYVDALVEQLETIDLDSFKQLVAQSLIFYEADIIEAKNRR